MPIMVHAIGEVRDYSIPVTALGTGSYKVDWAATAEGIGFSGTFTFKVSD